MRVLAIDPGEMVGWAHGTISRVHQQSSDPAAPLTTHTLELTGHGISSLKDMAMAVYSKAGDYDVIVYETWRLRASKAQTFIGNDFPTVQLIGMIRLAAWVAGTKLVDQGPGIKTTAEKSMKSMRPDLWEIVEPALKGRHDDGHHGDAILHLHHYFWTRYV